MKKFYKVTDMEEKPFSLVEVTKTAEGETAKVAERNSAADRVTFRELDSFNQRDFTGKVTEIDAEEFAAALKEWGVDAGNGAASVSEPAATATDGDAGKPTEGEPGTSTPAAASGEAQSHSDAGSTESSSGEAGKPADAGKEAEAPATASTDTASTTSSSDSVESPEVAAERPSAQAANA